MSNVLFTKNSKSLLAKLMAEEDLTVQHRKVETAFFDVEKRLLVVPIWKDMSDNLYDLFMGHEVGHALYTPADTEVLQEAIDRSNKDFVNVVEDARIEKMMKIKFPGLRAPFYKGYQELNERDFFGTNNKEISTFSFIDRINLFYKSSMNDFEFNMIFSEEEKPLVKKVGKTETFEEVAAVAEEIYNFIKDKVQNRQEQNSQQSGGEGSGEQSQNSEMSELKDDNSHSSSSSQTETENEEENQTDGSGDGGSSDDTGEDEQNSQESGSSSNSSDEESDGENGKSYTSAEEEQNANDVASLGGGSGFSDPDEFSSKTDNSMSENMSQMIDRMADNIEYYTLSDLNLKDHVISHDMIHDAIDAAKTYFYNNSDWTSFAKNNVDKISLYKKVLSDNNATINYLVKEFEMKKSAQEYAASYETKTGNLNTSKIWSYKLNDDIFKRKSITPEGKNHGMVMMVDWSGSMHSMLYKTVVQTVVLATFCKRVGIPFDVYNFSDQNRDYDDGKKLFADKKNGVYNNRTFIYNNVKLHHVLSSSMKKSEFIRACNNYLFLAWGLNNCYGLMRSNKLPHNVDLQLGGTPLNQSLMILDKVVHEFKRKHSVEKMNFVVLSDGAAGDTIEIVDENSGWHRSVAATWRHHPKTSVVYHERSKKTFVHQQGYRSKNKNAKNPTEFLVETMKEVHGAKSIGFYIIDRTYDLNNAIRAYVFRDRDGYHMYNNELSKVRSECRKNGFYAAKDCGYDEYYILDMRTQNEDSELEVDENMTKAKIAKQFSKFQGSKKTSRQMLNKFVDIVK